MAGPGLDGSGQMRRLVVGVALAACVAVIVYVAAGGAGPEAGDVTIVAVARVLTIGVATGLLLAWRRRRATGTGPTFAPRQRPPRPDGWATSIVRATRRPAGTASPGTPGHTTAGRRPDRPSTSAMWAPGPAAARSGPRPPGPVQVGMPQQARAQRTAGIPRATSGIGSGDSLLSPRRPWAVVGLGILAAILPLVPFALAGPDPTDEETLQLLGAAALLCAAPCLVAGMIAVWRGASRLVTWAQLAAGVMVVTVGFTILAAIVRDEETAATVLIGMLMLIGIVGSTGFVAGAALWSVAAGSPRVARQAGQPRR